MQAFVRFLVVLSAFAMACTLSLPMAENGFSFTKEEEAMLIRLLAKEMAAKSPEKLAMVLLSNGALEERASGDCSVNGYSAQCCGSLNVDGHVLNACVQAEFLPDELGVHLKVTVLGHDIIDDTVSVHDPPAICVGFPGVPLVKKMCVKLSDLDVTDGKLYGCIALEDKRFGKTVASVDLGCVNIG